MMVLLIVLAITVIGMGYLARADTELACGGNMLLRMQMDQLADSALEHTRGLLLHPQEVPTAYWTGATLQQLIAASQDYYDVSVARPDPEDRCTYGITCEAYRLAGSEKTGRSRLAAELRLDPCIALWANGDLTFRKDWVLCGDMRSGGKVVSVASKESVAGDVFSSTLTGSIVGRPGDVNSLSLAWPPVTVGYENPEYGSGVVSGILSGTTRAPAIWRCLGTGLVLDGNVTIQGMLLVDGDLTIRGNANKIVAAKNLPALYVGGHLIVEDVNGLQIEGLAVVDGDVRISAAASGVALVGSLFVGGTLIETTADASGNGHHALLRGTPQWTTGPLGGALQFDGVGDYVDCGTSLAFDIVSQITVAAWVNTKDAGDDKHHPYVTKGDHTYALKHRHLPEDPVNYIEFFIYDSDWQSARFPVDPNFNHEWHHVAGTYDGNRVRLYIDGVRKADPNYTGSIAVRPADPVSIGANSEWPDRSFQGAIDDVRIYNRALSDAEIGDVLRGGAVIPGPLVAHWALDEAGSVMTVTADPMRAAIMEGVNGAPRCWSPAAGAFFRSVRRQ
jgi:hypothetical protein